MSKAEKPKGAGDFIVRFWGVRGSFPVSGESYLHFGGNTSCVEIRAGGRLIVCDMGTGMIRLGNELLRAHLRSGADTNHRQPVEAVVLVSHAHHDHTQGFPFFKPAYLDSSDLHIFGPRVFNEDFKEIMARAMMAPLFPVDLADMRSRQVIRNVEESELIILRPNEAPEMVNTTRNNARLDGHTVSIRVLKNLAHPKGGVVNYRVSYEGRSVVYATDVEGYVGGDARLVNFARGADLLIHDAQYLPEEYTGLPVPTQGFGHSTFEMAAVVARAAGSKRLALFHHDPSHSDDDVREIEKQAAAIFPGAFAAYEGLEVSL
ncbi:MAG: MBL fold metallo-hydrolase [Acidobacteria bacterium]|nr:MBL fold metallo-hydrolase [Acidobacteriota bacterium]